MTEKVKKLEGWIGFFFVVTMALMIRVVYLQDALEEERQDYIQIEMEYQRLERRAQFYLEEYQDVADQRTYYYDRLVQITNNDEAQRYLEEK